ncbi:hypothetical protein [Evansella cellulosilytica]|uniref:Uncharacterized protein n=1 Tax=Evansella cellulosilytica (strain ATCC 21833 / DSM 2522 / FERM P-1141 / JCM 9156 / N-4) TaxID=649639 RepID=E6TUU1_EVAC2|nr:hypothetical protein [Evansella cellulosilytica]ADU32093.1 hypothetical protein Bcell_3854 [Evansella cellulosilytica DSM 2522]
MSRNWRIFIAAALAASLFMNILLFSKLERMEQEISHVVSYQHSIRSSVDDQADHIYSVMNQMQEDQSWLTPVSMDIDTTHMQSGQAAVKFEWQIKELPTDAHVVFNYALGSSETFTEVAVEEIKNGLFQVSIPFEANLKPDWYVTTHFSDGNSSASYDEVVDEHIDAKENEISYFVSMIDNGIVKSGTMDVTNIGYLGSSYYGFLYTDINRNNDDLYVNIQNDDYGAVHSLERVYVLKYKDGELIEEEALQTDVHQEGYEHSPTYLYTEEPLIVGSNSRFVLKAVYSNGETFEKEIHPN